MAISVARARFDKEFTLSIAGAGVTAPPYCGTERRRFRFQISGGVLAEV